MNEPEAVNVEQSKEMVVPVLREDLEISKQTVQTGSVLIHKTVSEREETVDEPLLANAVQIERVPVNRVVEAVIPVRQEGDVTVISVVEEQLVLTKQLVLKEEIRIANQRSEKREPQIIRLRTEAVNVERGTVSGALETGARPPLSSATENDFAAFQEGTIEVIETAEKNVVSKVARIVEEVVVSKETTQREEIIRDTVRQTEIEIEQLPPEQSKATAL